MGKINKEVLIDLLHTNAGKEALRKTISRANIASFAREVSDDIIYAQKYYVGNPDEKLLGMITPWDFIRENTD